MAGYKAKQDKFVQIEIPSMRYLMVDGHGTPGNAEYADALAALYPVAYKLKFASKQLGRDYVVPPLEGLWWAADMAAFIQAGRKDEWDWTLMLMTPQWITDEMLREARQKLAPTEPAALGKLRLDQLDEGTCVQYLHIGSYSDEGPMLRKLHEEYIPRNGLKMVGKHHEIYLSDARKTAPEKLRTILRQPVAKA